MAPGDLSEQLATALVPVLGPAVNVEELTRAPAGASRETWIFTAVSPEGGRRRLVLRRDPPGVAPSGLRLEGELLRAARRVGVPVPDVVVVGDDASVLGAGSLVMDFVEGETIPRRILRDEDLAPARRHLAAQCGRVLASIHTMAPADVPGLPGGDALEQLRAIVDRLGQPHPAFELAFRWLGDNRPPRSAQGVVHGDFRNGNLIIGPEGIRAVLDWELAHLGDPLEDLGWLCVKAWRFGAELPVGGFGAVEQLVAAYEEAGGVTVDAAALHWWEVLGTLRWGVICIVQTVTHLTAAVRSVELAAIGRRVCEVEWDLLELLARSGPAIDDAVVGDGGETAGAVDRSARSSAPTVHDAPSAAELLEAVGEFLRADVMAHTEGRLRFHARVAANVVDIVGRELTLGPGQASDHARRLRQLGVDSDAELADAIRSGRLDAGSDEVRRVVRASVAAKLAVAHPGYGD